MKTWENVDMKEEAAIMQATYKDPTYEHVFSKIDKYQEKIFPELDKVAREGRLPELLGKRWARILDGDDSTVAFTEFAQSLGQYAGMFDGRTQSHIAEYRELIGQLFRMDMGTETPNTYDPLRA